jgi:hypothetical protein
MRNRVTTLFELDALLSAPGPRRRARQGSAPTAQRAKPGTAPGPRHAGAQRRGEQKAAAHDSGAPIALTYDDAVAQSLSAPSAGDDAAWALQRGIDFEPFEDGIQGETAEQEQDDDDESPRLGAAPSASPAGAEAPAVLRSDDDASDDEKSDDEERGDELSDDELSAEASVSGRRRRDRARARTPYGDELAAFEREVSAMSAKQKADAPAAGPVMPAEREVFDDMAQAMEYANEFRLPPVALSQVFAELDEAIETENVRAARSMAASVQAAARAPAYAAPLTLPDDDSLEADLRLMAPPATSHAAALELVAEQLGAGALMHFAPANVVLGADEATAVFRFFWPDSDVTTLSAITDADREFAQALLVEAADASHSMGIVETLYRTFFAKVATSFGDVRNMLKKVARKAIEDRWFTRIKSVEDAEKQEIYESVRVTLSRNFRSAWDLRRQNGELTY